MKTELKIQLTKGELKGLACDALAIRYGVEREMVDLTITRAKPAPKRTAMQELADEIEVALAPAGGVFRGSSATIKEALLKSVEPDQVPELKRIKISTIGRAVALLGEKGFAVSQDRERQGPGRVVRVWTIERACS